jgi:hypothetical protein
MFVEEMEMDWIGVPIQGIERYEQGPVTNAVVKTVALLVEKLPPTPWQPTNEALHAALRQFSLSPETLVQVQ